MKSAASFADRFEQAEPAGWEAPDMSILDAGRGEPVPMPTDLFGTLWGLVADLATGAGAPVDYTAISFLATAASLIGANRRVQPFASSPQWREPCIIWAGVVGDPSFNKSPGLEAVTGILEEIEREYAADHLHALKQHEAKLERAKAERAEWAGLVKEATKGNLATPPMPEDAVLPEEPVRRRLVVKDATPESMAELLSGNPNGLMHFRDELAGWLQSFERYAPGGREFWLEAYGGRPYVVDRKSMKVPLFVPFNGVTVLGGIQPDKLSACMLGSSGDDGLVARFLWAWPAPVPFQRPKSIADMGLLERVFRKIQRLRVVRDDEGRTMPVIMLLDETAATIFETWAREASAAIQDTASLYKSFCGKLRGTVLRLALVSELLAWAAGNEDAEPQTIGVHSLSAAIEFVEDYAKPTALRVFGDAALPVSERDAASLARFILRQKFDRINSRDARRRPGVPANLKTPSAMDGAIEQLVEADWLRALHKPGAVGRPVKDYAVNPAVHAHG